MIALTAFVALATVSAVQSASAQTSGNQTSLPADHVFSRNTVLNGGYATGPAADNSAAWTVKGDNLTLDFGGAVFRSSKTPDQGLDQKVGIGLLLDGCHNVSIKNLKVSGYRFNIVIRNCTNVTVDGVDASYSRSIPIAQNGVPINSFLNLRNVDAWRTYGSGVWVENSADCKVQNVKACDSQNGILVVNSNTITLLNDDASFNSGWGIGLYHSSRCKVLWCHADFCNRPWAGDWGGDAAGIVAADECSENVFIGDSMTHGGDGFFLSDQVVGGWNDADKTYHFKGASNDNLIADCDGSWSSHNAFEGTFSDRNVYLDNRADNSQYGFWIGFSNDSVIAGNEIENNIQQGIAGAQGSRTRVEHNTFAGNTQDVAFWSDPGPADKQIPSHDHELFDNKSTGDLKLSTKNSSGVIYDAKGKIQSQFGTPSDRVPPANDSARVRKDLAAILSDGLQARPDNWQFYAETKLPKGDEWLQPGDYAPLDFRDQLFASRQKGHRSLVLYMLGPSQTVQVPAGTHFVNHEDMNEFEVVPNEPEDGIGTQMPFTITVIGAEGKKKESVSGFFTNQVWNCAWFQWKSPLLTYGDDAGWAKLFASDPLVRRNQDLLDGNFDEVSPIPGTVPVDHFALAAFTKLRLKAGSLIIRTLSDDGIRVYIDGKRVIDDWNQHAAKPDEYRTPVTAGIHSIRVEYCQESGSGVLNFSWELGPAS